MRASDVLPAEFNVATWFLDRHLQEGRGGAPAFHCGDQVLRYRAVAELANRTCHVLRELGVEMEMRVVVTCVDAPEFRGALRCEIRSSAVPAPVNTLLRTAAFRYIL